MHLIRQFWLGLLIFLAGCNKNPGRYIADADVVIYGGTSAAISAAVQLARMEKKVIIVCPEQHLGGMSTSGLGFTDTGDKSVIGGISREFYQKVYTAYQDNESWKWQKREDYGNVGQGTPAIDGDRKTMWIFEPHIAEQVFEDLIRENGIEVFRNRWLDRSYGVEKKAGKIVSIRMLNGDLFKGKIFIDATYEGDLMAAAGVSFNVGREPAAMYNEEWNGVQTGVFQHGHNFGNMKISPYKVPGDSSSGILPRISAEDPGRKGEGDRRVQAYCYRLCLTKIQENRLPFEKPDDYDSTQYELLVRVLQKGWNETFQKFDPIPNHKTDVNNHGPFGFDNIGMNYEYPEATYVRRAEIIKEHIAYQKGLLYFYANDPRIPVPVQNEMQQWGLAKDEFSDNGNWPYQIYVREARRMKGEYIMTEKEVLQGGRVPRPIGMGSYTLDSHNTQRYITPEGYVQNEGDIGVDPEKPYQIDMGCILPIRSECSNLLVPVAVSSSHIAFGSIRMEPVFMILGQSAGIMAKLALDKKKDLHELEYSEIEKLLIEAGQVIR
jgi:FAD dependent oxidoreductase